MRTLSLLMLVAAACGGTPNPQRPDASSPDPDPSPSDAGADTPPPIDATPDAPPEEPPIVLHVLDVAPQIGPASGGNAVTLQGVGFANGPIAARLGGAAMARVTTAGDTQLDGAAPTGSGFGDATVQIGTVTATLPHAYYHGAWARAGVSGGPITDIATAGTADVYVATPRGVFRSANHGTDWSSASAGLGSASIHGLAVDPLHPDHVFAATSRGVFVTASAGASWVSSGALTSEVFTIAIAPASPDILYAGTADTIQRSTDGGATWTAVLSLVRGLQTPHQIAIAASDPSIVVVATGDGIFKSADGGAHWSSISASLSDDDTLSVAIDPANPATLYAVTPPSASVLKSTDGGQSWTRTGFGFFAPRRIRIAPTGTLYVGTFFSQVITSTDGAAHWTDASSGILPDQAADMVLAVRDADPSELFAGLDGSGIYRSTNAAASWTKSDGGVSGNRVTIAQAHPLLPGVAFATLLDRSLWKTSDGGATWTLAVSGLPSGSILDRVKAIGFHPTQPEVLLTSTSQGVYRSSDGGQTWTASNQGVRGDLSIISFLFDPADVTRVFAAAGSGLYRSLDSGASWQRVAAGITSSEFDGIVRTGSALLTTNNRLYRSLDDGTTWEPFGAGLPTFGLGQLAVDPDHAATVYALASGIVHRSTDAGATWTAVTAPGVAAFAIDPSRPQTLYLAGNDGASVRRSLTGLATTVPFDAGLAPGLGLTISVDRGGGIVYLGGLDGLYRLGH